MSASPEFYRPWSSATPQPQLYSPRVLPGATAAADNDDQDEYYYSCRTPTGAGISSSYLGGTTTTTCPPAPRKPRPQPAACRKRLFDAAAIISVRYDELDRIFRPAPPAAPSKQRRSADKLRGGAASLNQVLIHNQ